MEFLSRYWTLLFSSSRLLVKLLRAFSRTGECVDVFYYSANLFGMRSRWSHVLPFSNLRMFKGGVMDLHYVRAHEHRSMAVVLPYIMHGLIDYTDLGEKCAVSYVLWRLALDKNTFEEVADGTDSDVGSLIDVGRLGSELQSNMNCLKAYLVSSDEQSTEFEGTIYNG